MAERKVAEMEKWIHETKEKKNDLARVIAWKMTTRTSLKIKYKSEMNLYYNLAKSGKFCLRL